MRTLLLAISLVVPTLALAEVNALSDDDLASAVAICNQHVKTHRVPGSKLVIAHNWDDGFAEICEPVLAESAHREQIRLSAAKRVYEALESIKDPKADAKADADRLNALLTKAK